jgi:cyclophilin family peptidyl-prolyl cis-trans isomerase/HEAT repeat protein
MRRRTPFACSVALALLFGTPLGARAQQQDEATVGLLARLLALSDAREFDGPTLRQALQSENASVRSQAALAAGRIGDPQAVTLLVPLLVDSVPTVQASAAFALGTLKDPAAIEPLLGIVRAAAPASQGAREIEAVSALAKIGGTGGAQAVRQVIEGAPLGQAVPATVSTALFEAWRLDSLAPMQQLVAYADNADATIRWRAVYSLARLRNAAAQPILLRSLSDQSAEVRAAAARGLSATLAESSRLGREAVVARLRPLVNDPDVEVRINALRTLASFRGDSQLAAAPIAALADANPGVVVQAETTLGVLGGSAAVAALRGQLGSPTFGIRRQAIIGLSEADSAAGTAAAAAVATDPDWRWRSVAAEAFSAGRNRASLDTLLADPDGRVVARALQGLFDIVPSGDSALVKRARTLLAHPDPAVRSIAADVLAKAPNPVDVDRLTASYLQAENDPFDDARLSAIGALAAIAAGSAAGRLAVVNRFVTPTPRPGDYLVRRLAAERMADAAIAWGRDDPIVTGKTDADYREVVRRYLLPALQGQSDPHVTIETDRGTLTLDLLPAAAPLTVAAFLTLVDRHYFDGQRWHRVVPGFVVQAGDPRGDGWGGPGSVLRDELSQERYGSGTVGLALSGPDTGGSQFFITLSPQPHLDGSYPVFGRVIGGQSILPLITQGDRIRSVHR